MAGIGFELKKLYSGKGVFSGIRAVGYSTAVCAGPMILGILLLLGITFLCSFFGRSDHDRELLVCMTTYSLIGSLLITSYFSMTITRFLADMLFSDHKEAILPSFFGINTITLVVGGILYAIYLFFCGSPFIQCFFCWCFFMELIVTWNAQNYLTAVKEYRMILLSYVLAIVVSLGLTALFLWKGAPTVTGVLIALCAGYGVMLLFDFALIFRRFPDSNLSPFMFMRWADKYHSLTFSGLFMTVGLFSHLIIIWCSPLRVIVEGLWMGAPYHDVPALVAFLSILITTVSFVVSVEVNFYPKYKDYFALYNDKGTIKDILRTEKEMVGTLKSELWYTGLKQLFFTAAVISIEEFVLGRLPLGFNDLMHGYFRTLCVGYGIYAVANCIFLMLLYFTDYRGALTASAVFAAATTGFTLLSLLFDVKYYGFGFLLGSAAFFIYSVVRLSYFTRKLPYFILAVQPLVGESKEGQFTKLGKMIEKKTEEERRK